jgi:hypothetical protein
LLNSKNKPYLSMNWISKNNKNFCYDFHLGQVIGLNIASEYENYSNWKKLLYSYTLPSISLKSYLNETDITFQNFIENIKLISPRPLDRHVENLPTQEIYNYIRSINQVEQNISHNILENYSRISWKLLSVHKKVLVQIINSIDTRKKVNFIFLERLNFTNQEAQIAAEILKNISHKYNLAIVVLAHSKLLPHIKWLPLFAAPIEKLSMDESDNEEDSDEAAS